MSENNRRHKRHDIQIDVVLTLMEKGPQTIRTHDISEGGMFLNAPSPSGYPLGEMVHIQYNDPLSNHADTEVDAIIVRVSSNGIGIAFIDMADF